MAIKRLSLLRHAKSSWDDPVERDFDRPLNKRGRRAARRMGEWLRTERLTFDAVLASPAQRIRETVDGVEEGLGHKLHPEWRQRIYMASAAILFDLIRDTPDEVEHLLLIGHNPGLEDLALLATSGDGGPLRATMAGKYPTAAFATLDFPIAHWTQADEGRATITRFIRPRDLDPALGPED